MNALCASLILAAGALSSAVKAPLPITAADKSCSTGAIYLYQPESFTQETLNVVNKLDARTVFFVDASTLDKIGSGAIGTLKKALRDGHDIGLISRDEDVNAATTVSIDKYTDDYKNYAEKIGEEQLVAAKLGLERELAQVNQVFGIKVRILTLTTADVPFNYGSGRPTVGELNRVALADFYRSLGVEVLPWRTQDMGGKSGAAINFVYPANFHKDLSYYTSFGDREADVQKTAELRADRDALMAADKESGAIEVTMQLLLKNNELFGTFNASNPIPDRSCKIQSSVGSNVGTTSLSSASNTLAGFAAAGALALAILAF